MHTQTCNQTRISDRARRGGSGAAWNELLHTDPDSENLLSGVVTYRHLWGEPNPYAHVNFGGNGVTVFPFPCPSMKFVPHLFAKHVNLGMNQFALDKLWVFGVDNHRRS